MSLPAAAQAARPPGAAAGLIGYVIWGLVPRCSFSLDEQGKPMGDRRATGALVHAWAGLLVLIAGHGDQVARVFRSPALLGQLAVSR